VCVNAINASSVDQHSHHALKEPSRACSYTTGRDFSVLCIAEIADDKTIKLGTHEDGTPTQCSLALSDVVLNAVENTSGRRCRQHTWKNHWAERASTLCERRHVRRRQVEGVMTEHPNVWTSTSKSVRGREQNGWPKCGTSRGRCHISDGNCNDHRPMNCRIQCCNLTSLCVCDQWGR
jgi:hypothetical protein